MAIHRKHWKNVMSKNPRVDYAYCAGIIDGEGCISIVKVRQNSRHSEYEWQLKVVVANTSLRILNKIKGVFGGHIYSRDKEDREYRIYYWHLYGKKAREALKKMKPYIQEKKEQSDLAIKFNVYISNRILKKATRKLSDREIAFRDKMYWRMRNLKKEFLTPINLPIAPAETKRENTQMSEAIVQTN